MNKVLIRRASVLFFILSVTASAAQYHSASARKRSSDHGCRAWIETQREDTLMSVSANFMNNTDTVVAVSYSLVSRHTGASGTSATGQKGKVEVKAHQVRVLSNVCMNVSSGDSYEFILAASMNGKKFFRDSVDYNLKRKK